MVTESKEAKYQRIKNRPEPPYYGPLGLKIVEVGEGMAKVRLSYARAVTNPYGMVAGGIITTLADTAVATALLTLVEDEILVSLEHKINFFRPAKGDLIAEARVLNRGRSLAVAEAAVLDDQGRPLAKGLFTYAIREKKPLAGDEPGQARTI